MPPAPANPAHTPTALARPSGGKTLVIVDKVPGMIRAAPTPVSTRHMMSEPAELLSADARARDAENRDTGKECPAAAEPVADRARREQRTRPTRPCTRRRSTVGRSAMRRAQP